MNKKELGDCYEVHAKELLMNPKSLGFPVDEARLCHGTVWHPDTGWHGHCWIEINNDVVFDMSNGSQVIARREVYYAQGKVKDVKRYTVEESREMLLEKGTWGAWDDTSKDNEKV